MRCRPTGVLVRASPGQARPRLAAVGPAGADRAAARVHRRPAGPRRPPAARRRDPLPRRRRPPAAGRHRAAAGRGDPPAARVGAAVPGQRPAQRRDHRRRRRPRPRARRRCARDRAERPSAGRRVRDDARRRPGRRRRRSRITVARWLADAGIAPPVAGSHTGSAPSTRTCRSSLSRAVATSSSRWLPDGYAVLGDAVCSLNSLYAQGMSMALREAALLGRIVDRHGTRGVGVAFLREATRWSTPPGRWRPARTSATRRSPGRGRSPGGCSISTSANLQRRTRGGGAGVSHDTNPRRCSRGTGYWR